MNNQLASINLTEEDKVTINKLKSYPFKKLSSICRRKRRDTDIKPEALLSMDDLTEEQLRDLLPKIDLYVNEIQQSNIKAYEETKNLCLMDEMWIIEYACLKDSISKRLNENSK